MPNKHRDELVEEFGKHLINVVAETNGISLSDTLELLGHEIELKKNKRALEQLNQFKENLSKFKVRDTDIEVLLSHPVSRAFFNFFKSFPLPYHEDHIHLTGSLSAEFIYPRLKALLEGPNKKIYEQKIADNYGAAALPIKSPADVDRLIRLKEGEQFKTYLKILYLAKLVLTDRASHADAAFHMASELAQKYNIGNLRLKFTLSRASGMKDEQIPGQSDITEEDVLLGLYDGFMRYKKNHPHFNFVLSPSFRKEAEFYDQENFDDKRDHFDHQVDQILEIIEKHPHLRPYLCEADTVGDEKELYRKIHFSEMKNGLRRLQYNGFKIRSHHGETWKILRTGVQSVDNAMNIWHIDTLEHGLSLGINPNFYFHRLFQRIMEKNQQKIAILPGEQPYDELTDMEWHDIAVKNKLLAGTPLNEAEITSFIKTKFHTAREIEHYQHDVLNRMINKGVSLISLPSSNLKLTGFFPDYKDHPFSWWEKKGVKLGVGTDNYITLNTNFIREMLILLYSDPDNLKITKLLMVVTKEQRRPYLSHLLWEMRKKIH